MAVTPPHAVVAMAGVTADLEHFASSRAGSSTVDKDLVTGLRVHQASFDIAGESRVRSRVGLAVLGPSSANRW